MGRKRGIIIGIGICCCAAVLLAILWNGNTTVPGKTVLWIDGGSRASCQEIIIEDCRDSYVDYCKEKGTLLYVNSQNQIVEKDIAGAERIIEIEADGFTETLSNAAYAPFGESIYFIYEKNIYQYSVDDKTLMKKTDGIDSAWRRTYLWENEEYGYKLIDNGKYSELYRMDKNGENAQKVCEGWIQSIGQLQEDKIYALEVYSNAADDSSTADLRNRIIAVDILNGTIESVQEMGNWMEGNYVFTCSGEDIFYIQKKGKKEYLYRVNLSTGKKEKVYATRNQVVGLAVY